MIRKLVVFTMTIVFLLCPQVKANQHSVSTVKESIVKHSIELGIDPALALSIAKSESGFRHEARSTHGAVGVFQLMPSTAKKLGVNPYYLSDNIKGGLMYYKRLYNMFGSTELALAAYNAGPAVVKKYNRVPPYGETKHFVSSIMSEYHNQKSNPDPAIVRAGGHKAASRDAVAHKAVAHKVVAHKSNSNVTKTHFVVEKKVPAKIIAKKIAPKVLAPIVLPSQGIV